MKTINYLRSTLLRRQETAGRKALNGLGYISVVGQMLLFHHFIR